MQKVSNEMSVYDYTQSDLEVERKFVGKLDRDEYAKLFIKLLPISKIDTPLVNYNLD